MTAILVFVSGTLEENSTNVTNVSSNMTHSAITIEFNGTIVDISFNMSYEINVSISIFTDGVTYTSSNLTDEVANTIRLSNFTATMFDVAINCFMHPSSTADECVVMIINDAMNINGAYYFLCTYQGYF